MHFHFTSQWEHKKKPFFFAKQLACMLEEKKAIREPVLEEGLCRGVSLLEHLFLPRQTLQLVHTKGWGVLLMNSSFPSASASDPNDFWSPKSRDKDESLKEADRHACCPVPLSCLMVAGSITLVPPAVWNRPPEKLQQCALFFLLSIFP